MKELEKKDIKNILILDIKTTCWDGKTPKGQISEIIKVNICILNTQEEKKINRETFFLKNTHLLM